MVTLGYFDPMRKLYPDNGPRQKVLNSNDYNFGNTNFSNCFYFRSQLMGSLSSNAVNSSPASGENSANLRYEEMDPELVALSIWLIDQQTIQKPDRQESEILITATDSRNFLSIPRPSPCLDLCIEEMFIKILCECVFLVQWLKLKNRDKRFRKVNLRRLI